LNKAKRKENNSAKNESQEKPKKTENGEAKAQE
jgi:hypothetical protein